MDKVYYWPDIFDRIDAGDYTPTDVNEWLEADWGWLTSKYGEFIKPPRTAQNYPADRLLKRAIDSFYFVLEDLFRHDKMSTLLRIKYAAIQSVAQRVMLENDGFVKPYEVAFQIVQDGPNSTIVTRRTYNVDLKDPYTFVSFVEAKAALLILIQDRLDHYVMAWDRILSMTHDQANPGCEPDEP